jgi:hypothetical protein
LYLRSSFLNEELITVDGTLASQFEGSQAIEDFSRESVKAKEFRVDYGINVERVVNSGVFWTATSIIIDNLHFKIILVLYIFGRGDGRLHCFHHHSLFYSIYTLNLSI